MTFETVASIDFQALNKRDLKRLCTLARDEWGKPIDLRSSALQMAEYLELYRQWKLNQKIEETKAVEQVEEVTTPEIAEVETVDEVVEVAIAPQEEEAAPTPSNFEGINDAPLGEPIASSPLTCDVLNHQACELPEQRNVAADFIHEKSYWEQWNEIYSSAIASLQPKPQSQTVPQTIQPEADVSAKVVGLMAIAFLALMVDGILWIVKEVQQRRLVQRSFSAAMLVVQRHRPRAKGFRPALLVNS
ncbi:MAG: hypothetical protein KME28_13070 [Pelatocladus maniniholoensis HA4357-MV3]|jgi:hypothetical protein|uniref:Uncharacterized protein n=1 Tax=Pelatocladus maniniholoensis HA4357-MV3 TaxID=1117104 RepID=A0A9E3LTI6_9NOST|nr:hypothetical protein [Pelatocladus maniniholoensis HA4357-MV3]BAZ65565.1 hypothetical protein NIES4106_03040 [Fischerella sp. NIES-4106]